MLFWISLISLVGSLLGFTLSLILLFRRRRVTLVLYFGFDQREMMESILNQFKEIGEVIRYTSGPATEKPEYKEFWKFTVLFKNAYATYKFGHVQAGTQIFPNQQALHKYFNQERWNQEKE